MKIRVFRPAPGPSLSRKITGTRWGDSVILLKNIYRNFSPLGRQLKGGSIAIALLATLLSVPANAQQPDSIDTQLEQYLQYAAQNNPELKARFYEYRSMLAQVPQVGTLPDPEVMFMYFINPPEYTNPFTRTTVSVTQRFPWFGSLETAENRVRELANAQLASLINVRNELFGDIKETWYRMHEIDHHLMILRENMELLNTLEARALSLYETGNIGQVDVLRLQMEIDRLRNRILRMKEQMGPLRVEFNTLLNRESEAEILLPKMMEQQTLALTAEQLVQKIIVQNPSLSQLDFREEAAWYSLKEARLNGLPSFGIGVEAMMPNYMFMAMMPGDRTALSAKLSVKVPLYRSRYRAQRQEARLIIRSIEAEKNQQINTLIAEAEKLLQQYRDAQYRITLHEDNLIPKTRQALQISIESYSTEAANFEELISLQQQLLEYEMGLNTAYVERNIAIAAIEALYGRYNINPEEIEFEN